MLRSGAVDELAGEVADQFPAVPHTHAATVGDIGNVSDFYVVGRAILAEGLHILRFHYHRHPLLRLADSQFGGVQAGIFGGHAVQPNVQAIRQFAYRHAHSACTEVVALLDKPGDLRTAEKPLELAFLRGITLLDLAAASLEGAFCMFLGGAGSPAYSVPAGAAAEKQHHIAGSRALATHVSSANSSHDSTYLHALGSVAVRIDFPHMGSCKAYLVAVAGVSACGLAADHTLGQFARDGIRNAGAYISRAGHAHGLVDVCPAGQRVADGTSEAGSCSAERFDFGGMVMGFVLELQQPLFGFPVHCGIYEDAACIVFFALLLVVQFAFGLQPAGADGGKLHQAEWLLYPAEFLAHGSEPAQAVFQLRLQERIVYGNFLYF